MIHHCPVCTQLTEVAGRYRSGSNADRTYAGDAPEIEDFEETVCEGCGTRITQEDVLNQLLRDEG